jgi:endoglucanase
VAPPRGAAPEPRQRAGQVEGEDEMSKRELTIGARRDTDPAALGDGSRFRGLAGRAAVLLAAGGLCAGVLAGCSKKGSRAEAQAPAPAASAPPVDGKHSLLKNASFKDGSSLPWLTSFSAPAKGSTDVKNGALCLTMDDKGANAWDAQLVQRPLVIQQGHSYAVDFRAWATAPTKIRPKVGMAGPPYTEYWAARIDVGTEPRRFQGSFTMGSSDDKTAEFTFHLAGALAKSVPVTICIDDLYLSDPQFDAPPPEELRPAPKVAVNQLGYLPKLAKVAVFETSATEPQTWELVNASGEVVASGQTEPFGPDPNSGNSVQHIDFSSYKSEGRDFVLRVGEDKSYPFDIRRDVYSKLKYDALAYFYHSRSGIEIKMPFAGEEQWARPAGHLPDKAPCAKDIGCDYTLDVTGGWYDAGDHGKYVVNGGFSAWTLMNQWERTKHLGKSIKDFGDGKLKVPEQDNGVDDLLDEARWEVEFLMAMQAPDGSEFAGMVHHKMHDEGWTAIGIRPDQDTLKRSLRPVSTAATLNMAAAAAQASRVFEKSDAAFSKKALAAAEKAYAAALKYPAKYADPKDNNNGGGDYSDDYVKDEFFWAAAELFLTTEDAKYRQDFEANPHDEKFLHNDGTGGLMTWKEVDALGVISLAVVPSKLKKPERDKYRKRLIAEADRYIEHSNKEGYGVPFDPGDKDGKPAYPWGSNSFIATNSMVIALAYDFTKKPVYRNAVLEAADYLLGMNPMGQSYITGYGDKPLENPHHRFWAKQSRADFPSAPPGILSGGPNSDLQDPYVQAAGLKKKGCAPQKCYLDNIEAWSVNEITINWNSPLAWVTSFLDEQGR